MFHLNWIFILNHAILGGFKLFGLCPLHQKGETRRDSILSACLRALSIIQLSIVLFIIYRSFNTFVHDSSDLSSFNNILTFTIILSTHVVIIVESLITCKNFPNIMTNIDFIDGKLREMIENYDASILEFSKKLSKIIIAYVLIIMIASEGVIYYNVSNDENLFFLWSSYIFSLTTSRLRHLQHYVYVNLISCRLKTIKNELKFIVKLTQMNDNALIRNDNFTNALFGKINFTKSIYNITWESSLLINKSFGFSQLFNLLQNFVQLTCDLYVFYEFLYKNNFDLIVGESKLTTIINILINKKV
jgi:hypothetical protein